MAVTMGTGMGTCMVARRGKPNQNQYLMLKQTQKQTHTTTTTASASDTTVASMDTMVATMGTHTSTMEVKESCHLSPNTALLNQNLLNLQTTFAMDSDYKKHLYCKNIMIKDDPTKTFRSCS